MSGARRGGEPICDLPAIWPAAGCHTRAEPLPMAMPSWARAFPGTAAQVRGARRFVESLLDRSPFLDDAVTIVSELVTNAILHTRSGKPGGLVIVQVTRWRLGVRTAVTDQGSPDSPVIRDSDPCCQPELPESGTGLYLVGHLAERLDWHEEASGRTIYAILGTRPPEHYYYPQPRGLASRSPDGGGGRVREPVPLRDAPDHAVAPGVLTP